MPTPAVILQCLKPLSHVDGFDMVERFLRDPRTRVHKGGTDGRVTVKMTDHAWGTRLAIARKRKQKPVPGSEHLVQSLARLPDTTILKSVVLEGPSAVGAVWCVEETGEPVGFVLVRPSSTIGSLTE